MIVLYGATGYTGRLIAHELDRRGASFAIAGRAREKLDELAAALSRRVEVRVADVADAVALRAALEGARVVLTCAGPFATLGPPLQDAALDARAHFLDITGEPAYMRATFARDGLARARGVALVNAVGFDVVPTDLAVHLAAVGLGRVRLLELAMSVTSAGASRGTLQSAVQTLGQPGTCFHEGAWREEPIATHRRVAPFPPPVGAREVVSVPFGDVVTAPRTAGAREVRTYVRLPRRLARTLPLLHRAWRVVDGLGAPQLAARLMQRLPEGPSPERRSATKFALWARAEAEDGRVREVGALGSDVYGLTGVIAAHAAMELAAPGPHPTGALTPTQALDPVALRAALAAFGTEYVVHEGR